MATIWQCRCPTSKFEVLLQKLMLQLRKHNHLTYRQRKAIHLQLSHPALKMTSEVKFDAQLQNLTLVVKF